MTDKIDPLKQAVVRMLTHPLDQQKRTDDLLDSVFKLNTKSEQGVVIQSFFKLISARLNELDLTSIEVLMRLIYFLEIDADPVSDDEVGRVDRDTAWNLEISSVLIKKLREAIGILGIQERQFSPSEMLQQERALKAYVTTERIEMQKGMYSGGPGEKLRSDIVD